MRGTRPNKNSTGSIYDVVPPVLNAMKRAGVWNRYHVVFDWPVCRVWLNGILVQDNRFLGQSGAEVPHEERPPRPFKPRTRGLVP